MLQETAGDTPALATLGGKEWFSVRRAGRSCWAYLSPLIYALRPKLRLRMLSSSISVIDIVDAHFSDERFSRIVGRIGFSALVLDFNEAKDGDGDFGACVVAASTSTTLSTALPSKTRRTLSLSRDAEDRCKRSHVLI